MPTHHHYHHHRHGEPPPISVPTKPNQKLLSLLLKSIIMGLIISLFLLFLGVAAIAFLHFLLIGSVLHRRRHRSSSSFSPSIASSAFSPDQLQTHLPPFKYNNSRFITSKDCSICLECFKEGEICRTLPVCDHVFHVGCVDQWLTRVPNCPVCRTRVRLNTGSVSDSGVSDDDDFKLFWSFGV